MVPFCCSGDELLSSHGLCNAKFDLIHSHILHIRLAERLRQLDREGRPEVCVMAHGWRRFKQLFGDDPELCELDGE